MDTNDYKTIRQLFDDYILMYVSRDDRLTSYFSEDFSGFTGGGDFLVKDKEEWVAITRQDFSQVKDPLRIELKDIAIQSLSDTIAVTTGFFTIHLPIKDHILSRETARLVLIFRKESTGWKITHSSISIPYYLVREGEVYPLKELTDRNQKLEEVIAERTIQLSEANDNLLQTNEELAKEIAERKRAEKIQSDLIEKNPMSIQIMDKEGFTLKVNSAHTLLFGPAPPPDFSIFTDLQNKGFDEFILLAKKGEVAYFPDIYFNVHDIYSELPDKPVWIRAVLFPLEDIDGNPERFVFMHEDITERKRTEKALQDSEQRFHQLADATFEGVAITESGRILDVNRSLLEMLRYEKVEELLGKSVIELIPLEYRELVNTHMVAEYEEPYESMLARKDGTTFSVEVHGKMMEMAGRRVRITAIRDITERKQADAALRESEAKFRTIIDVSPVPYGLNDDKGNITFLNQAFNTVFGYTLEEIPTLNEWWTKAYPSPEYRKWAATTWQEHLERAKQERTAFEPIEVIIQCKNGLLRTAIASAASLGESFAGIHVVILYDITDRKQLEEALLKRKQQYDSLVANVPVGVYIMRSTPAGASTFEYVSPKVSKIFNVTAEDFLTDPRVGFRPIHPEDLESLVKLNQEVFKQPRPFSWEGRAVIEGAVTWLIISSTPEQLADGDVLWHGVVADITERKQNEEALAKLEKLEAIGTLAAGVAHDFNNLLGVMFGYLELSQMEAEKTHQQEIATYLTQARSAFDRAKDLTGQLLTFSKGGAPVRKVQSLPEHVRRTISFSLSGSQLAPEFGIPDDIWLSNFDEHQLAQVLDNMVINARQAMTQGGVLNVSISNIKASDAPDILPSHDYVCVSIRDHGTGIAPEHLPHIFDPFFTTKKMGSGLGLATSYSIIRQHDGLIDVDSVVGKGTTFHVYLPASSESALAVADDKPQTHRGRGHILIMDDEEMILDMLALVLENMGYEAVKTRHGKEAKEKMRETLLAGKHFIAAILDLTIPSGLGGKEIVYALLALDPTIKVIASSGYANDPIMSNPADFGFAGRLTKPYRRSDLVAVFGTVLSDSE